MVRIRLRRVGSKNQPSYRIVAAEKESPRDGRFLENLGHYNPRTEPSTIVVDEARLFHWLQHGAQPSDAVLKILKSLGTWDRWERFKGGEDLDTLLEEAKESQIEVDPRTRRDDLFGERRAKKAAAKKEKAVDEKAGEEEPAVEEEIVEEPVESTEEEPAASEEVETASEHEQEEPEAVTVEAPEETSKEAETEVVEDEPATTEEEDAEAVEEEAEEPSEEEDQEDS
jgi:small subunit ribosomal protein S16